MDVAEYREVSKHSVCHAVAVLQKSGFIRKDKNGFLSLTDAGKKVAEKIYERHLLLSSWLERLGVSPEVAAEDACRMEHVISTESFEALKRHIAR